MSVSTLSLHVNSVEATKNCAILSTGKSWLNYLVHKVYPLNFLSFDFIGKVHIFWEGHKILRNLHLTFDLHYIGQK